MNQTRTTSRLKAVSAVICTTFTVALLVSCGGGDASEETVKSLESSQVKPLANSGLMTEAPLTPKSVANSTSALAGPNPAAGSEPDPCDPQVMGKDKAAAQACFEKMSLSCAKKVLTGWPGVVSKGGTIDQQCVDKSIKTCTACVSNPTGAACLECANKVIANCTDIPTLNPAWVEAYKTCMTSVVAGMGTAFLQVWDDLYDARTQVDHELRVAGCTRESGESAVCTAACGRTTSCRYSTDPFTGRANKERCDICFDLCKADFNYCLKLANP